MLDAMMAGSNAMAIGSIEARLAKLAARLEKFDKMATIAMLGGLLTDPEFHANTVRIEVLIHLVALRSNGTVKPNAAKLREWLNEVLGADHVVHLEDPPEDVFLANVVSGIGNSLLFEGIWEANAGYVQSVLYAINTCLSHGQEWSKHCLRQSSALLRLSNVIAERSGLSRNALSGGYRLGRMQFSTARIQELSGRVRFTSADLTQAGIHPFDLRPFIFDPQQGSALRHETISWTSLEARPIVMDGEDMVVALPTAIGAAIRRRAIRMALDHNSGDLFQTYLTEYQFGNRVTNALLGLGFEQLTEPNIDDASGFVDMICRFDVGAYAHILFIQDRIDAVAAEGFHSIQNVTPDVHRLASDGVVAIEAMTDFRIGMTILVFGGLGRGFQADAGRLPLHWCLVGLGNEDFELFAEDSNTTALQMYRLLDQKRELFEINTKLVNPNGFLNLYGYAKSNDFELIPDFVSRGNSMVQLGTDYLTSIRTGIRRALDHHGVLVEPRNSYAEVRRQSTEMYFPDLSEEPSYMSVTDAMTGRPAAAIEIDNRTWWIEIEYDGGPVPYGSLLYRVWDMARNWTVMIARHVSATVATLPEFIAIEIAFPQGTDLNAEAFSDNSEPIRPVVTVTDAVIHIDCSIDYLRAFGRAENIGDRWMVETIIEGALILADSADAALVERITNIIVTDTASRHLHVLTPRTAADYVLATAQLPPLRLVQAEVRAWADIGLAQRCGIAAGTTRMIEEKEEAIMFLSKAVDIIWGEIRERLKLIDRTSVVEMCIDNHNAIDRDRATWRHTAAAVLHLHPREEVMRAAVKRESELSEAGLCCRVVVEMAVCTSPTTGGRTCSFDDFDFLVAHVSLLCGLASRSDEIHHGFAEKIEIKPSGVLRFEDEFANRTSGLFLGALSRNQFDAAAADYNKLYNVPEQIDDDEYERQRNPEFDAAFVAEYGVTPIRMADFISRLSDRAVDSGNGRITVRCSELKAHLIAMDGVNADSADVMLNAWCLLPRSKWDEARPSNAKEKDWYPWRYARRLSLLSKPIVQLTVEDDPMCLVSPVIADHSLKYALSAYNALLPEAYFQSKEMRSWIGSTIDRLGHRFNRIVASRLRELGLQAEAEFLMSRLGGDAADGDVDTLAWNTATGDIFIIECKRLLIDKTVGEIAERLVEFAPNHVEKNGRRGPTRRHLDRVAILRNRTTQLAAVTGINEDSIRIMSCLVTSSLVPMQFQVALASHFNIISDLDDLENQIVKLEKKNRRS